MAAEWQRSRRGTLLHVQVWGDLDIEGAPALDVPVGDGVERIVVDLRRVEFIDSMGICALVRLHRQAPVRIVVTDGSPVRRLLAMAGLESVFETYEHPAEAIRRRPDLRHDGRGLARADHDRSGTRGVGT